MNSAPDCLTGSVSRKSNRISVVAVNPKYLENREFSFTLEDDVYVRYQSFSSQEEFEKVVKSRLPHKIDIGAVYTLRLRFAYFVDAFLS